MTENGPSESRPQPMELCGLWEQRDRSGRRYLVGTLGGVRLLVLQSERCGNDREPTHRLMVAPATPKPRRSESKPTKGMPKRPPTGNDPSAGIFD